MKVGDYVELASGMEGTLSEINMRSSTLQTGDGKDIMVPNEKFITSAFTNWTKSDRQRHEVIFAVAYDADIHRIPELIANAAAKHPHILARPSVPVCEVRRFGETGIHFAVSYWVSGTRSYLSDVHFLVWDTLKEAGIALVPAK
jgi:small-conductance mechanosensitive channel